MPTKIGKSVRQRDGSVVHDYIKGRSTTNLIEEFNKHNTRPKDKVKIRKEYV